MRINRSLALLAFMVSTVLAVPGASFAQTSNTPAAATASSTGFKIAVLDEQKILGESKAAQNVENQLKAKRDSVEKELSGLERKLAAQKDKLDSDKNKVKPEDFSKEVSTYQNDYLSARKLADARRHDLEQAANGGLGQLRTAITKIVTDLAQKNGYLLVLTRQNIVLADSSLDITDQVLQQLDRTVTAIPLTFGEQPKKAPAPAKAP